MKNLGFISTMANRLRKRLGWCPKTPKLEDYQKTTGLSFALGKPRLIATPVALTASYCLVESAVLFFFLNFVIYSSNSSNYTREQQYINGFVTSIVYILLVVLLFAVSYFVGKKFDLKYDLVSIIISLFLGSLIVYVPLEIYYGALAPAYYTFPLMSLVSFFGIISGCMEVFLVSFAGMAVAYLKSRNISFYEFRLRIGLHNLRNNWKVLGWAMSSLIIAEGFTSLAEDYLIIKFSFEFYKNQYEPLLYNVRILIYPILFVVVLYLIGRSLNIEAFPIIAFSLFIGCFVGVIVSNLIIYLAPIGSPNLFSLLETGDIMAISYDCFSFVYALIYDFILGLSALAIGSLTKKTS
jgi:hypothetical protein